MKRQLPSTHTLSLPCLSTSTLTTEFKPRRLEPPQPISRRNVPPTITVRKILQQASDAAESALALIQFRCNTVDQPLRLDFTHRTCWQHADRACDPHNSLLRHELDELQQHTAAISKAVAGESDHHACHDAVDELLSVGSEELLDCSLDLRRIWLAGRARRVGSAVGDDIADVAQGGDEWVALLERHGGDGSLEDWCEEGRRDEAVRIVEDGVSEETEEVFNNIWEFAWLEAGHHAQSGARLGFKEGVNSISRCRADSVSVLGEFAEDGGSDPKETALFGFFEIKSKLVRHFWEERLHSCAIRDDHISPATADTLADWRTFDECLYDLRQQREYLLAVLHSRMDLTWFNIWNDPLDEDGEQLNHICMTSVS